jgi:phenylpropionate dioxygenase-like ring-hydroxylating dioxygenase large terminal subunit
MPRAGTFEPDLRRAVTPPAELYVDPAWLARERERVFARAWQPVAHLDALAASGDQACAELAERPIVVVRDGGALRGFHNVCRHRAGPVAVGAGRRASLQCRYHGWTYGLDGRLLRAPEMEEACDFDPAAVALEPVAVAAWGPLVFATLDPAAPPLAEVLAGVTAIGGLRFALRRDYLVDCNWKVYVDNYLEGYHIPLVHPELHRELDYDAYRTETFRHASLQHAPLRASASRYRPAAPGEPNRYWWVFPNLMLNVYEGQVQTNLVVPLGPERTRVVFEWFAADPPADPAADPGWARLLDMSELVQAQDTAICEAVQRNLRGGAYRGGRYSPRRENGVHHFHGLLHESLHAG